MILGRILVKISVCTEFIQFHLIGWPNKEPLVFWIFRDAFKDLEQKETVVVDVYGSFAVLHRDDVDGTVSIRFVKVFPVHNGLFDGWQQTIKLSYKELCTFLKASSEVIRPLEWNVLSLEKNRPARLLFLERENLHDVVGNRRVRRQLFRFLNDIEYWWDDADEVRFCNDSLRYSFRFQKFRCGKPGTKGWLYYFDMGALGSGSKNNYHIINTGG